MSKVFNVSKSGFYEWSSRAPSATQLANEELADKIEDIFFENKMRYGSPRITKELNEQGVKCSENRVARIMKNRGIKAFAKPKFRITTDSNHKLPVSPNLLNRNFIADKPNQVWVSDITYIYTSEGWLFLCVIIDLYSRRVVGWSTSSKINTALLVDSFLNAVITRQPSEGLIFHSDRGVQYASKQFREYLKLYGIKQSMSRKGNCWDNACAESFFSTIKREEINRYKLSSRAEAHSILFEYIELFYNLNRRHSHIGNISPADYEKNNQLRVR